MIKTKFIRRHHVQEAVRSFQSEGKLLEVGSGKRWRAFPHSVTFNRDASAEADVMGDAENMEFADGEFDGVVCLEVLEHTTSPQKLVDEIWRVLKPGGRLLLTVPFSFEIHDRFDYFRFTRQGLEHLLRGFSSLQIKPNGGKYSVLFHFLRLGPLGGIVFPLLNNFGHLLDRIFKQENPSVTLGYTLVAVK